MANNSTTTSGGFGVSINSGTREIADGVHVIQECIARDPVEDPMDREMLDWYRTGEELHATQNAYLFEGEKTLLFDTLTPAARDIILENIDELLGDNPLDYLVVSHPEANHAGNTGAILEAYPEATLVAPVYGVHHELFQLDSETRYVGDGDTIDLVGRVIEFHEPTFFDHAMTIYLSDSQTGTLCTVDWFGYEHMGSDCLHFADEQDDVGEGDLEVAPGQFNRFQGYAFVWIRYVDPDKTDDAIDALREAVDIELIAPSHGLPIRSHVDEHMDLMKAEIRKVSEDQTNYDVHGHGQLLLARDVSYRPMG
jgi:flavorubredoxin